MWGGGGDASGREIGSDMSGWCMGSSLVIDSIAEAEQWVGWRRVQVRLWDRVSKKLAAQNSGKSKVGFLSCGEKSVQMYNALDSNM